MLHPLLETVSNFVWRIAVPRPWPAEHVRPERSDAASDRGRISRNNARANLLLAVQSIMVTPFTCVYVSAATHLGRQPGVFPFRGNFRAFRAIIAAEGVRGLFKVRASVLRADAVLAAPTLACSSMVLTWVALAVTAGRLAAHVGAHASRLRADDAGARAMAMGTLQLGVLDSGARVRATQIRGLNPRTKKWEPYTRLTRLARWSCSLLIHALESVVRTLPRHFAAPER
jgi:hypothetical protein